MMTAIGVLFCLHICMGLAMVNRTVYLPGTVAVEWEVFPNLQLTWNEASHFCQSKGGHLATPNTHLAMHALGQACIHWFPQNSVPKAEIPEIWIGLHSAGSGQHPNVWERDCSLQDKEVHFWDRSVDEPNQLSVCLCNRVVSGVRVGEMVWRTERCNRPHTVLCEYDKGNCSYVTFFGQKMTSEAKAWALNISDISECWRVCVEVRMRGMECVAAELRASRAVCGLWLRSQLLLTDNVSMTEEKGTTVLIRTCFHSFKNTTVTEHQYTNKDLNPVPAAQSCGEQYQEAYYIDYLPPPVVFDYPSYNASNVAPSSTAMAPPQTEMTSQSTEKTSLYKELTLQPTMMTSSLAITTMSRSTEFTSPSTAITSLLTGITSISADITSPSTSLPTETVSTEMGLTSSSSVSQFSSLLSINSFQSPIPQTQTTAGSTNSIVVSPLAESTAAEATTVTSAGKADWTDSVSSQVSGLSFTLSSSPPDLSTTDNLSLSVTKVVKSAPPLSLISFQGSLTMSTSFEDNSTMSTSFEDSLTKSTPFQDNLIMSTSIENRLTMSTSFVDSSTISTSFEDILTMSMSFEDSLIISTVFEDSSTILTSFKNSLTMSASFEDSITASTPTPDKNSIRISTAFEDEVMVSELIEERASIPSSFENSAKTPRDVTTPISTSSVFSHTPTPTSTPRKTTPALCPCACRRHTNSSSSLPLTAGLNETKRTAEIISVNITSRYRRSKTSSYVNRTLDTCMGLIFVITSFTLVSLFMLCDCNKHPRYRRHC